MVIHECVSISKTEHLSVETWILRYHAGKVTWSTRNHAPNTEKRTYRKQYSSIRENDIETGRKVSKNGYRKAIYWNRYFSTRFYRERCRFRYQSPDLGRRERERERDLSPLPISIFREIPKKFVLFLRECCVTPVFDKIIPVLIYGENTDFDIFILILRPLYEFGDIASSCWK